MKQGGTDDAHRSVNKIATLKVDSARKIADRAALGNDFAAFQLCQIDVSKLRKRA